MEQRRLTGKSHWYHETQSSLCPADPLPLVPEAAKVEDRFLLDLPLDDVNIAAHAPWCDAARALIPSLLPDKHDVTRLHTLSVYDRLSTALTVAQVCGVQRLCNHYAARLAPEPGPDSSRESNRRLTLLTQTARQLASSPTLIDSAARTQLEDAGLSVHDIVTFTQIIGFVGFQARAVALLQAQPGQPARWLPGIDMQQDAPASLFTAHEPRWQPDLPTLEMGWASAEQQAAYNAALDEPLLQPLLSLLAHDACALQGLAALLASLRGHEITPDAALVALVSARINGSVSCFDEAALRLRDAPGLADAARNGERALLAWSHNHQRARAIIQAMQMLTRAPARFGHAQLEPLTDAGFDAQTALRLLAWGSVCGWVNRLRLGLGVTTQPAAV
ncbi:CMD domain-containing protein [Cronobacter turicensis]|uniref:CMD domain-containing protein n=1 Tax=Cronobacter turicensis TaxID=413502 RepID=UPI0024C3F18A|nr:CMD domain-containing protein [Cronobacter turicensis]MDK1185506.1 CMD domain-containing protein [Cronobacter turicensis]MDK1205760.1 CMD domain-containing protein [Cronobacter turicensis]MDK1213931.1 CMD domain-containing protein [Cronobacter turicensis]MDK1218657.1 CMD domain-containing protein [Cronobacter turicensis]MDK1229623.1 CMD domain-containing protein [Cronobacter turicensis]